MLEVVFDDEDANDDPKVTVKENPLVNLRGPALGSLGLLPLYVSFINNKSYLPGRYTHDHTIPIVQKPVSQADGEYIWAQVKILKADVPNLKINDLALFFSKRVSLYRDDCPTHTTKPYFLVYGPMFINTDNTAMQTRSLYAGNHMDSLHTPKTRLYCQNTPFKEGGKIFMDSIDNNGNYKQIQAKILDLPTWYEDKGDHFMFYLSGLPTNEADIDIGRSGSRQLWSNTSDPGPSADGHADYYSYHVYKNAYHDVTDDIYDLVHSFVDIDTTNTVNQFDAKSTATYTIATKVRETVTRRPTMGDPIPVFTPLDFFERFNTGWKDDAPIQMMTDVNGGFRITVLDDKLTTLRISQQLIYDMGLNTYLTQEGITSTDPDKSEYKVSCLQVTKIEGPDFISIFQWQNDYNNPSTLQSHVIVGELHEFVIIDQTTGAETGPLLHDTDFPCFVMQTISGKFFKALDIIESKVRNTNIGSQFYEGRNYEAPDGLPYLEWTNPVKGAFLGNENTVSVGSFSIYENIRLVATGFGFQPFIVAGAQEPVLCELRLPFSNSAELMSGSGVDQITITDTTSQFYGDIIYSAPASGHQYLRLNSQAPIFDMSIECRLIPRDPDQQSEIVMLGFSDVFQVKLRWLMRN